MATLSIRPSLEIFGAEVSRRHRPPGYEHVTLIAPGVGSRELIEDHNYVIHVKVHEIQPEVGATGLPPWKSLHWSGNGHGCLQ